MEKDRTEPTISTIPLCCLECGRFWIEAAERWRLYLSREDPLQRLLYCPDCAQREFD